jgi:DNA repair protein RecO (recombination protein O)
MMPLSMITADIRIDATRDLQILNNSTREEVWRNIYFNPVKSSIAIFIAEFLNSYLRFSETDPLLWDYVADSIRVLDRMKRGSANLHLGFLIGLLHYTGISPDLSEARTHPERRQWFDMREGSMTYTPPLHRDYIEPEKIRALCSLIRMTPQNCKAYHLNGSERREILDLLLRYYSIHFPSIGNLKSPAVLREIFS